MNKLIKIEDFKGQDLFLNNLLQVSRVKIE